MKLLRLPLALLLSLLATGPLLSAQGTSATQEPLRVVTLHPILTELAAAVGGETARVEGLVPGGVDPHTYEPAPREAAAARSADLVVATGLGLETYLERLADPDGRADRILRVGERLPLRLTQDTDHPGCSVACGAGEADPHWWHGLGNALFVADLLRAEFARLRPADAAGFAARAQVLQQRLFALQAWAGREIATLPPARRHLVTTHDAFGHLARDFDFQVHPVGGLSTENEADARRLSALVATVRRLGVKAVFADAEGSARLVRALSGETGANIPPALYADGPGAPGSGVETYEAMYRHNLSTIVSALR
jgi:zinc/manganese transport system substrate-binding protein